MMKPCPSRNYYEFIDNEAGIGLFLLNGEPQLPTAEDNYINCFYSELTAAKLPNGSRQRIPVIGNALPVQHCLEIVGRPQTR